MRANCTVTRRFQCSSASRKFLNTDTHRATPVCNRVSVLFSEPKIPQSWRSAGFSISIVTFQCSSASRKFLNLSDVPASAALLNEFQCSSASRKFLNYRPDRACSGAARFQCSSASRKFLNEVKIFRCDRQFHVSVLFSEPKIPQCHAARALLRRALGFSALQRAENSSMVR